MRPLLAASLVSLVLAAAPAVAASYDALQKPPGAVSLSAATTVQLQANPSGDHLHLFWADVGGEEEPETILATVRSGNGGSSVNPAVADALGLKRSKVKIGGNDYETVTLPRVVVGDAVFTEVQAVVPSAWGGAHDLELSLPAMGVAWALLPSQGQLVLAPASEGQAMVGKVDGAKLAFTTEEPRRLKFGKKKYELTGESLVVPLTVGGQEAQVLVGTTMASNISDDLQVEGTASQLGDQRFVWTDVDAGGVDLGSAWFNATSAYWIYSIELGEPVRKGTVGRDLLFNMDLAVDPGGVFAVAPVSEVNVADPRARIVELAQEDLDSCLEPEEPLPEEMAATPAGERCAAQYGALADAKSMAGDLAGALEARTAVSDAAPQLCENWLFMGALQLQLGQPDDAVSSLSRASEQYHAWYAMDPWQRDDAQKDFDKLSEEEQDAATLRPQSRACASVDGLLAVAHLASDDVDAIATLYDEKLDLDSTLASVYGSTLILADQVEKAHGPWRMVDHLNHVPSLEAKAGLGRLFAQQGDWASAQVNYRRALELDPDDLTVALMWADDMAAALGVQDAMAEVRKWAAARPDSMAARVAVARVARIGNKGTDFLTKEADPLFESYLARYGGTGQVEAAYAVYLAETGRVEQARELAEAAVEQAPDSAQAWLAKATVHEIAAEFAKARRAYSRAVAAGGEHPGYALLLPKARSGK